MNTPEQSEVDQRIEADIKGEVHYSRKDRRELLEFDFSEYDAVYREGKDPDFFGRTLTIGYLIFAIGYLLYGGTFGRIYVSSDEFEKTVEANCTRFYKIDADVHEIFDMVPYWKRVLYLFVISPLFALILVGAVFGSGSWLLRLLGISTPEWAVLIALIIVFLLFGLIWAYCYFHIIILETIKNRDEFMANEVMCTSKNLQYEKVLISCGDAHRTGIGSRLEDRCWNVSHHPTKSWLGLLFRFIDWLTWPLYNPKLTYHRVKSKLV